MDCLPPLIHAVNAFPNEGIGKLHFTCKCIELDRFRSIEMVDMR